MARMEIEGFGDIEELLNKMGELPDEITDEMLNAGADIVVRAQKDSAGRMLQGPYYKGAVRDSIKKKAPKKTNDGKEIAIEFVGTQHGEPLSRIAYVNEYGKKSQKARPFIKTANESCAEEVIAMEEKILNDWLDSQ